MTRRRRVGIKDIVYICAVVCYVAVTIALLNRAHGWAQLLVVVACVAVAIPLGTVLRRWHRS